MEIFGSYSGGMVSQTHPEKLKDNQSILIENADIIQGGSLEARGAYAQSNNCEVIHFYTMDDLADEGITFNNLTSYTFAQISTGGVSRPNHDDSKYFKTMEQYIVEKITFDVLKNYTMDSLKNQGVLKPNTGDSQGMFRYYTSDGFTDIVAIKGKLYTIADDIIYKKLPISGLRNFQTTRTINAVQYRDKMYIATGSGLVVYDGTKASLVSAYRPTGLEALYVGTNGYAANPDNYLSDTTGAANTILGVTTSTRYGVINQPVIFTAYIESIPSDILEYKFEYKNVNDIDYIMVKDWSTSKELSTSFQLQGDYMIRVSLREQGAPLLISQYILPRYTINTTFGDKEEDTGINFDNLAACNKIFIHYDRLFLYGDTKNKDHLYISHLNKFDYFPRSNTIKVTDPLRGAIQSVKQFRHFLIFFTDGSIQIMTGMSPTDYTTEYIHTTLGTTHPYSVQVMRNYLSFIGNDNGVYILKPVRMTTLTSTMMDVQRIDLDIRDTMTDLVTKSTKTLSTITDTQYFLYIETDKQNYVYRYYYDYNIWVRDKIELSFQTLGTLNNIVTACATNNGTIYKLDKTKFLDGTNSTYTMKIISKDFNFNLPHHRKKLKQYQLITKLTPVTTIEVRIFADNTLLNVTTLNYDSNQNSDAQKLSVTSSGRFRYVKTEVSTIVKEALQLIGYGFVFKQNTPK